MIILLGIFRHHLLCILNVLLCTPYFRYHWCFMVWGLINVLRCGRIYDVGISDEVCLCSNDVYICSNDMMYCVNSKDPFPGFDGLIQPWFLPWLLRLHSIFLDTKKVSIALNYILPDWIERHMAAIVSVQTVLIAYSVTVRRFQLAL